MSKKVFAIGLTAVIIFELALIRTLLFFVPVKVLLITAGIVFLLSQITILFTSVYLHRSLAHRTVKLHWLVALFMQTWLWVFTYQVARTWVAVHLKHHSAADKEGDPHSPYVFGVWNIFFWGVYYYDQETRKPETIAKYAKGVPHSKLDFLLERSLRGLAAGTLLFTVGFSLWLGVWPGVAVGIAALLAGILIYQAMGNAVNSVCHWFGYKNFDNTATNVPWVGLWTAGEGWHNNHHHDPFSPKLGYRWWELDVSWWFIKCLSAVGLAQPQLTISEKETAEKITEPPL